MFFKRKREQEVEHKFCVPDEAIDEFDGSQVEFELANELRFMGEYVADDRKPI